MELQTVKIILSLFLLVHFLIPFRFYSSINVSCTFKGKPLWGWDAPFSFTRQRFIENKDPSIIWEGHKAGRDMGYCQIEKLTSLDLLPATGFTVCCFPYKIKDASAGFTRCVAIFDLPMI